MALSACINTIFTNRNAFGKTQITLNRTKIDLGVLKQHSPKEASFIIKNTGDSILVIQQVKTSCGCTTPKWTKKPISIGDSGIVSVTYDAKHPGKFIKTITVYANVEDSPVKLNISGEVEFEQLSASKK
jgi:hypothetical protein